jgi:hypothetical protein
MNFFTLHEQLQAIVHGEVFTAVFLKKDGTERTMKCTLTEELSTLLDGYLHVWDVEKGGHRNVNLRTIVQVTFEEKVYQIKGDTWHCVST